MIWVVMIVCALVSIVATGLIRHFALQRNLLAIPNERSSHTQATPHGGGLAIVISFLLAIVLLTLSGDLTFSSLWFFLVFGGGMALLGLVDDIFHIPARWRLLVHFGAAILALAWLGGMPPTVIAGVTLDLSWFGHIVAVVYLVWLLNLYNFMDGIDGIAGIEAITVCAGGVLLYWLHDTASYPPLFPVMLIAATLGFLWWNFPRARIFMGDTGSAFLGFMLGLFSIQSAWHAPELFWGWLVLLGCFIVDATVTLIRRILRGEKFYQAHRSHAYQYASRKYGSHVGVSIGYGLVNIAWLLPLAVLTVTGWLDGLLALLIAYVPLVYLAFRLKAGARELQ